jgi:hypothetical protein
MTCTQNEVKYYADETCDEIVGIAYLRCDGFVTREGDTSGNLWYETDQCCGNTSCDCIQGEYVSCGGTHQACGACE